MNLRVDSPGNLGTRLPLKTAYRIYICLLVFRLSEISMLSKLTTNACCTGCGCVCSLLVAIVNKREGRTEFNA